MGNFRPSDQQIERFLKSQGLFKQTMFGEDSCWKLKEVNFGVFTHVIHEVDKSKPFTHSIDFLVNESTCLQRSANPYTNESEFEDMSKQWQEILNQ